jgi:hypothetical protein
VIESTRCWRAGDDVSCSFPRNPFIEHLPVGESRDSVFTRRLRRNELRQNSCRSNRPTKPFDGHRLPNCRNPLKERLFQEVRRSARGGCRRSPSLRELTAVGDVRFVETRTQSGRISRAASRQAVVHQYMPELLQVLERLCMATPVQPRVWLLMQRRFSDADDRGI